jgi:hypothetical protein
MDTLSQLDVQSPDHVVVNTCDDNVTILVTKQGKSITLGFTLAHTFIPKELPIKKRYIPIEQTNIFDTSSKTRRVFHRHAYRKGPNPKLTESQVREIKSMVSDPEIISKFRNVTEAHKKIGKAYNVTGIAISNIARNISWKHIKI